MKTTCIYFLRFKNRSSLMTFELNVIIHKGKQNIINKKNELKFVHVLCVVKVKHHDSSCCWLGSHGTIVLIRLNQFFYL